MKTLSVKQPWAQLICTPHDDDPSRGIKDIENRTWACPKKHIGIRVLIHASGTEVKDGIDLVSCIDDEAARRLWFLQNDKKIHRSAIIGSVEIVDCVINHESIWAEKTKKRYNIPSGMWHNEDPIIYNFVLANPILFPEPISAKGKLGFWEYKNIDSFEINGRLICDCNHSIIRQPDYTALITIKGKVHCRFCGGIH